MPSQRADAAKNRERIILEARKLFATATNTASLEAIAQAAGVGIGTLYRHFPTKEALVETVYQSELEALDLVAVNLLSCQRSFDAMRLWMSCYAQFAAAKYAMHDALRIALSSPSGGSETRARINAVIAKFLTAGSKDGSIRDDIRSDDVTLSLAGIIFAATACADHHQISRILDLLMEGLRPHAP